MAAALGDNSSAQWLDPCVGAGAFPSALSSMGVGYERITTLDVNDIDSNLALVLENHSRSDFVQWARVTSRRFDRFIANPPYVSLNKLPPTLRAPALRVSQPDGRAVGLGSNYWYVFVCAALQLLNRGASASLLLPAAFDHADYSAPLRDRLSALFETVDIYRCHRPLFTGVQDGCVVVVATGYGHGDGRAPTRHEYETSDALVTGLTEGSSSRIHVRDHEASGDIDDVCRLGDVVQFRIGGVTGDSKYFLLSEEERLACGLPTQALRPILSKSRHLSTATIGTNGWRSLRDAGERIWLFDPPPFALRHPAVQRYIAKPEQDGGCRRDRYKIRKREPWYRTPMPSTFDGFISGMSSRGPWIALKGWSRINATNTLYTVRFRRSLPESERYAWALTLLSSRARRSADELGRRYPDGLLKFEPSDLANIIVPVPRLRRGSKGIYSRAVSALLVGDAVGATVLADEWLSRGVDEDEG